MRWQRLFADLEAQLDRAERDELDSEVSERTRIEVGRIELSARIIAAVGRHVDCRVLGGLRVRGELTSAGVDWVVVLDDRAREWLLPRAGVAALGGLPLTTQPPPQSAAARLISDRLDLRRALREVARDRSGVVVHLSDGAVIGGTLDRVGTDHVDVAEHAAGEWRRVGAVREVLSVPLPALAAVTRQSE